MKKIFIPLGFLILTVLACGGSPATSTRSPLSPTHTAMDRYGLLGDKVSPEDDFWPPTTSNGWSKPEPLPFPLNTAGAEDSPFITPDNLTMYFFFTPDISIPAEKQLYDGVTGIWSSERRENGWSEPIHITLVDGGELVLDGCGFVLDDEMWFCSARQGNFRSVDLYIASFQDGKWINWRNAGKQINETFEVGEMHLSADGQTLYFGSTRPGGLGGYDLWVAHKNGDAWGEPINLGSQVNTIGDENRPYLSQDGSQLWFDAASRLGRPGPAIYVSTMQPDGSWGQAEEIVSTFAGEPTLNADGKTLYFVHHYFTADLNRMLEADIYVSTHP
jgi:hypothetical protein